MSRPEPAEDHVTVAVANITPSSATVLVTAGDPAEPVQGQVVGPWCRQGRTLPNRVPLDSGAAPGGVSAVAHVVDPCFWSPRFPAYYQLTIRFEDPNGPPPVERWIAIRHLAVRKQSLYFEGKRWVLRGVWGREVEVEHLTMMNGLGLAWITDQWDGGQLTEASLAGTPVVVDLSQVDPGRLVRRLREAARWPAVIAAIWPAHLDEPNAARQTAPNLLAAHWHPADGPAALEARKADVSVVAEQQLMAPGVGGPAEPLARWVVGQEPAGSQPSQWRSACERLQMRLAPQWDLAGYIVCLSSR